MIIPALFSILTDDFSLVLGGSTAGAPWTCGHTPLPGAFQPPVDVTTVVALGRFFAFDGRAASRPWPNRLFLSGGRLYAEGYFAIMK